MTQTKIVPSENSSVSSQTHDVFARLMDLTYGWYQFTEEQSEANQSAFVSELFQLYQSVATYTEPFETSSEEVKEAVAMKFIYERLIPTLLKK